MHSIDSVDLLCNKELARVLGLAGSLVRCQILNNMGNFIARDFRLKDKSRTVVLQHK